MRADSLALVVSVAVVGLASHGCGGSPSAPDQQPAAPSVDCGPSLSVEWHVELPGEEIPSGDSRVATLLPGIAFPLTCAERVAVVDWTLEGPAVARVTVIPGADSSVTSRAWLTGLTPGLAVLHARVVLRDGSAHEARPATVRVGGAMAPRAGDSSWTRWSRSGASRPPFRRPRRCPSYSPSRAGSRSWSTGTRWTRQASSSRSAKASGTRRRAYYLL